MDSFGPKDYRWLAPTIPIKSSRTISLDQIARMCSIIHDTEHRIGLPRIHITQYPHILYIGLNPPHQVQPSLLRLQVHQPRFRRLVCSLRTFNNVLALDG